MFMLSLFNIVQILSLVKKRVSSNEVHGGSDVLGVSLSRVFVVLQM